MLQELAIFKSARLESMQGTGFDAHIVGYGMKILQMFFFGQIVQFLLFLLVFCPFHQEVLLVENDSDHHTAINSYLLWQQQTFAWSSLVCCRLGAGGGGSTKFNRQRLEVKLKILPEMSIDDAKYVWSNYAYCLELMTGAKLVMGQVDDSLLGFCLFVGGLQIDPRADSFIYGTQQSS